MVWLRADGDSPQLFGSAREAGTLDDGRKGLHLGKLGPPHYVSRT